MKENSNFSIVDYSSVIHLRNPPKILIDNQTTQDREKRTHKRLYFGLQLICYDSNFYERRNIDDTNPESDRNDKHLEENENQH